MTDVPFGSLESFIAEYYRHNPDGHYFDPEMLKYFGEDKALMRVINRAMMLATDMFGNGPFKPYYVLVRPPKVKYQVETWERLASIASKVSRHCKRPSENCAK